MQRTDLIGTRGTITRDIEVIDAKEERGEVDIRVRDSMGNEYWTALDGDVSLD